MSVDHYENFPVASVLLPAALRPAVTHIYRFARTADDLADEGDASAGQRLAALTCFERELDRIAAALGRDDAPAGGQADSAPCDANVPGVDLPRIFVPLRETIARHALSVTPFRRLLSAFKQDVVTTRYEDYPSLIDYCNRSAAPVGEIMLGLYGTCDQDNLALSDAICNALQLTNFWQDVGIDWAKGRVYLPQQDLRRFGVSEAQIAEARVDDAWRALMTFQVERARALLHFGAPLALRLPGRVGWELRLVVQGGARILERIENAGFDVFRARPTLGKSDWLLMAWRACRMQRTLPARNQAHDA